MKTQPTPVKSKCPDLSGHLLLQFRITKKGFSAHQLHHFSNTQHVYGPFQVVHLYRQRHFRSCAFQLSKQEPGIAHNPLLQISKRVFDDRSSVDHHVGIGLHSLFHSLKCGFVGMTRNVSAFCLGTPTFQRASGALIDGSMVNPVAFVEGFKRESLVVGALVGVTFFVVTKERAIK